MGPTLLDHIIQGTVGNILLKLEKKHIVFYLYTHLIYFYSPDSKYSLIYPDYTSTTQTLVTNRMTCFEDPQGF